LASPLTTACRYESDPFWCNGDGFRTMRPNRWLDSIDITNFERRSFARAAIVVPVHMPFGQIGAVSFTSTDPSRTDLSAEFAEHGETLGVFSRAFISSYQRVMVAPERLPVGGSMLSKREVECLRWAAIGKTDYEISLIMARSRATVRFHIHNAATKLDAVNRSQTVFKAAQLGYIGLNS
jgi:DNA-binding CsgD family transcriptional regulator